MTQNRFQWVDGFEYTLEERRREYNRADAKGRIRLLRRMYRNTYELPFEIAQMAVNDPNVEVREWIAQNGSHLDYSEREWQKDENGTDSRLIHHNPERDLKARLRQDPDPFVRACIYENAHTFLLESQCEEAFPAANHLERLAMMRNPHLPLRLVAKLINLKDPEFGLETEKRRELVLIAVSNPHVSEDSKKDWGEGDYERGRLCEEIWRRAFEWPERSGVPGSVISHIWAPIETKILMYKECKDPFFRKLILQSCDDNEWKTDKIVEIAVQDPDEEIRELAWSKVRDKEPDQLSKVVWSEDTDLVVLAGLANNPKVPLKDLDHLCARLMGTGKMPDGALCGERISKRIDKEVLRKPERPEAMFGTEPAQNYTLDDKIDYLADYFFRFQEGLGGQLSEYGRGINRMLLLLYILIAFDILLILKCIF